MNCASRKPVCASGPTMASSITSGTSGASRRPTPAMRGHSIAWTSTANQSFPLTAKSRLSFGTSWLLGWSRALVSAVSLCWMRGWPGRLAGTRWRATSPKCARRVSRRSPLGSQSARRPVFGARSSSKRCPPCKSTCLKQYRCCLPSIPKSRRCPCSPTLLLVHKRHNASPAIPLK